MWALLMVVDSFLGVSLFILDDGGVYGGGVVGVSLFIFDTGGVYGGGVVDKDDVVYFCVWKCWHV